MSSEVVRGDGGGDNTLVRERVKYFLGLIDEYELVKAKMHTKYKFVSEFYRDKGLKRQNFIKYYNRFKTDRSNTGLLLPKKRGAKYHTKFHPIVERKVVELRATGYNKFEIKQACVERYNKKFTPSESTIYNICKKYGLNKLHTKVKQNKVRTIIKEKAGDLGHIDCHYLPKGLIQNESSNKRYYLVAVMDDATRLVWADVVPNIKAIKVMFSTMGILTMLKTQYGIEFKEMLTDNGSEFGSGKDVKNKDEHPFELLLQELNIKHRYTKPYRPQTNGKIERFWRTLEEDMIKETDYETLEDFEKELAQYIYYYNELRPHTSLNGKTPKEFNEGLCKKEIKKND